jgi:hypothetical protein
MGLRLSVAEESGQSFVGNEVENLCRPAHLHQHSPVARIFAVLNRLESAETLTDRQFFV